MNAIISGSVTHGTGHEKPGKAHPDIYPKHPPQKHTPDNHKVPSSRRRRLQTPGFALEFGPLPCPIQ